MPNVLFVSCILTALLIAPIIWYIRAQDNASAKGVTAPVLLTSSTFHSRFKPILHSFRYPVLYIGLDLDCLERSYNDNIFSLVAKVWRVLSLRSDDYMGSKHVGGIKEKLWAHMSDHGVQTESLRRAFLVTTPRLFGYSFNPVSFHYVYDKEEQLKVVVLEVNNTFGEKHIYVLRQDEARDRTRSGYTSAQTFPRRFHVSPFNDRSGSYQLQCLDPFVDSELKIDMHLTLLEPDGTKKLTAQVNSTNAPIPTTNTVLALWTLLTYGGAVFLTTPRILYEAYKLHYGKKLAVYLRPEPHEDLSAIGRQIAGSSETYFMELWLEYLRANKEWIPCKLVKFDLLPASTHERFIEIEGSGDGELLIVVLSYQFFNSLATSSSPLTCLWTDSLSMQSPLFRVSDQRLFLEVFSAGFCRPLDGRFYLQRYRDSYRGQPNWFQSELSQVEPSHVQYLSQSNNGLDNHVFDMSLKAKRSLWRYRYHTVLTLWLAWFGNTVFGAIATFAGEAGGPADEWPRVKLEFMRRKDNISSTEEGVTRNLQ